VPFESFGAVSYLPAIVSNYGVSRHVLSFATFRQIIGRNSQNFYNPPAFRRNFADMFDTHETRMNVRWRNYDNML